MQAKQTISVSQKACVNCFLRTPEQNHRCIHCGKNRSEKEGVISRSNDPYQLHLNAIIGGEADDSIM